MKSKLKQELYTSPEAKEIEIKAENVLCASEPEATLNDVNNW